MQEDIIGQRIYEIRTSKRMTQLSLGMKLGVSQETISAYENNKTFPTLSNIIFKYVIITRKSGII